jgi:uncharacterized membrane protein
MLDTIAGLPIHPLIVHATVVLVPAAAVAVALAALWPRFRRWAGIGPLALAAVAAVLVPVSTESGESLEERVGESALLAQHVRLGDQLLPWVLLIAAVAGVMYLLDRRAAGRAPFSGRPEGVPAGRALAVAVAGLALVGSLGTTIQVVRIGHSGAEAAWSDVVDSTPAGVDAD